VTSTQDSGPGTLRQALIDARTGDTITFSPLIFPPAAPVTITLQEWLPEITIDNLTIDGSDAGIILDGSNLGRTGLVVRGASGVTIRGLQIIRFISGIGLIDGATNTTIGGDRTIGTGPLGQGNLLSDNEIAGVEIMGNATQNNHILGNYVGTDITGRAARPNGSAGIQITDGASYNTIGGATPGTNNLISGNGSFGLVIFGQGNVVQGNYIGTDATGTGRLGNGGNGLVLGFGSRENVIGGVVSGARNLISANGGSGIQLSPGASENAIMGNYVGTGVVGKLALGTEAAASN